VVSNELAGLDRPRKQRAFDSLPMPGVRGALARADEHGWQPAPGRFLGSVHAQHQVAWLGGEVAWSMSEGRLPLADAGTLVADAPGGPWTVRASDAGIRLRIGEGGHALRSHALLLALTLPAAARVDIATAVPGAGLEQATGFDVAEAGTYLGFIALDAHARTVGGVVLDVTGVDSLRLFDLALVTYG
jgi:hypothetical protein